ncbi:MAG: TIGR00282 family metallophosphoesterase [Deltaproteobacteria bacterium]|nr:TIGR00282 family metallophosphoesterase [Deltaproteobacteria bacterium]
MNILFLGDIFGEPGRLAIKNLLPRLKEQYSLDLVLANGENAARGRGITTKLAKEILASGVDLITGGNHILQVTEVYPCLNEKDSRVIRPCNFPKQAPGRGVGIVKSKSGVSVGVINVIGNMYLNGAADLPYDAIDDAIQKIRDEADIIVVDMHAEATSEKRAMGWYLDGRVQLVVGTHTHVQTADEEILPGGTAFITDLGMCGPYNSVIGMDKNIILKRFRTGMPQKFEIGVGDVRVCGIVCEIDLYTKKAVTISRICERE